MKENENLQVKKVKEINENTFEIFEDQDVRFFEKGGKLALDINYSEFPESTDPPSDASQIQLLPQNQRSLLLDGLEIVRAALEREDYSDVYYAFFVEYARPKSQLLSTFYRVCTIRFQKPGLYDALVKKIMSKASPWNHWKQLSPIDADCVLFETNSKDLVLERTTIVRQEYVEFKKTGSWPEIYPLRYEHSIRAILKSKEKDYAKALKQTKERGKDDELQRALIDALSPRVEKRLNNLLSRKNEHCGFCQYDMDLKETSVLACDHIFCTEGIKAALKHEKTSGEEFKCPICRKKVEKSKIVPTLDRIHGIKVLKKLLNL